jgi:predicted DNA-binding protein (MmcQ/YjbR family)
MNAEEIRKYCMAFPEASENLQWGDDLCFKIRGKIFTIVNLDNPRLCFKCAPETFAELIEREDIHPAPYVGRYKWVMLDRLDALGHEELRELIRQSYELVASKAPGKTAKDSGAKKSGTKSKKKRPAAQKKGKKKR